MADGLFLLVVVFLFLYFFFLKILHGLIPSSENYQMRFFIRDIDAHVLPS